MRMTEKTQNTVFRDSILRLGDEFPLTLRSRLLGCIQAVGEENVREYYYAVNPSFVQYPFLLYVAISS